MELIIRKYENIESQFARIANEKNDSLSDIVIAMEIGFVYEANKRHFFNYHTFCFHYCVDIYQGNKNISFNILNSDDDTGEYCFWKYNQNFYKEKLNSRKIEIDNSQISIYKVDNGFVIKDKESFDSVVDKVKTDLFHTHETILKKFDEYGINYNDTEMNHFSKRLKHFINEGYLSLRQSELQKFIKEYEVLSLEHSLSQKDKKTNKKLKI